MENQTPSDVTPTGAGVFSDCGISAEAASGQRLRERDEAERFYSAASATHCTALGSERDCLLNVEAMGPCVLNAILQEAFTVLKALTLTLREFEGGESTADQLHEDLRSATRLLEGTLLRHGLSRIDERGVPFDPRLHEPIDVESSSGVTEAVVGEIYDWGYQLEGKVLKRAIVEVIRPAHQTRSN